MPKTVAFLPLESNPIYSAVESRFGIGRGILIDDCGFAFSRAEISQCVWSEEHVDS